MSTVCPHDPAAHRRDPHCGSLPARAPSLAWLSFGLDYTVWGLRPLGFHLTNVVLHAVNAALVLVLGRALLGRAGLAARALDVGSFAAALFFALHPLRVESVAWITERRDLLAGTFCLLAVVVYVRAVEAVGRRRLVLRIASLGFYLLALLAKPIVMTLPAVLLVIDAYPLRRGWTRAVLLEKLPYLVLALGGVATGIGIAARASFTSASWPERLAISGYGLWFYLEKTFLPVGLSPLHELPVAVPPLGAPYLPASLAVVAITAGVLISRRRWPAALAVWIVYVVMVTPYLGIVHAGFQLVAARYTYLSTVGFAMLLGGAAGALVRVRERGLVSVTITRAAAVALTVWLVTLGALTVMQIGVWRDDVTLWTWALDVQPDCALCHENLGIEIYTRGERAAGIALIERALALRPDRVRTHARLGTALFGVGRYDAAASHLERFLAVKPDDALALNNLGAVLLKLGRPAEALARLDRAVAADTGLAEAWANRAVALTALGRSDSAMWSRQVAAAIGGWPLRPRVNVILLAD